MALSTVGPELEAFVLDLCRWWFLGGSHPLGFACSSRMNNYFREVMMEASTCGMAQHSSLWPALHVCWAFISYWPDYILKMQTGVDATWSIAPEWAWNCKLKWLCLRILLSCTCSFKFSHYAAFSAVCCLCVFGKRASLWFLKSCEMCAASLQWPLLNSLGVCGAGVWNKDLGADWSGEVLLHLGAT